MKTQVISLHGGSTFDSYEQYLDYLRSEDFDIDKVNRKDWKSKLQEDLGEGYEVLMPQMPNKANAKYIEWKIWFDKIVPFIKNGAILIGHSLGGIFLTKYLSENNISKKIKGLFIVAAPFDGLGPGESLADFIIPKDFSKLITQVEKIYLYQSKDDPVVRFEEVNKYKKALPDAQVQIFDDKKHFNQGNFPEIVDDIKNCK